MSEIFELEEVLDALQDGQETEGKVYTVDNDYKADWAVKKIAEHRADLERVKLIAQQQIEEIDLKIKNLEKITERKTAFLRGCLARYFETVPHKATKTKETYKLLSGSLEFKIPKQNMVKDDAELLEYFHKNGMEEYIKTEEKPAWGEYKKKLSIVDGQVIDTVTGEVVEVVKVEETAGVFEVKTS